MPGYLVDDTRKVTTHRLKEMKAEGKKIAMLTSYDFTTAKIVDEAGVDMILIGDSASNVMAGNMTTLPHYARPNDLSCPIGGACGKTCARGVRHAFRHLSD